MKEVTYSSMLVVLFVTAVVAEPASQPQWRTPVNYLNQQQQQRVQAHSGLTVVDPPKFQPKQRFSRRGGSLPGYLPLRPVSPTARNPRWYSTETAPKPSYSRPPPNYERYPPFWGDESVKSTPPRNKRPTPPTQYSPFRHGKKECNPCNSVPWTPIFKSPAGLSSDHHARELVPHVEVYPEPSIQQPAVLLPHSYTPELPSVTLTPAVNDQTSGAILDGGQDLTSLPLGNIPVAPDLLLPPQQVIPFPELSTVPVAPVHQSVQFLPDPQGLVPPVPPKATSNVVVTISEPEEPRDVHQGSYDQHSEPSSLVDTHSPRQNYHHHPLHGGVDIVKSVPLAEYVSSIQYPFQIIQSPPIIDIESRPNSTNLFDNTYEKPPQTGSQKVSDYLLTIGQDPDTRKLLPDNASSASKDNEQTAFPSGTTKGPRYESIFRENIDPNILTPPPLPPHLTQLLPTLETAFLHPLFPIENQGIASVVNGALLPPPMPQPMNPTSVQPSETTIPPKKIQIIIPYTTVNNQEYHDQNALGSGLQPVNESLPEPPKVGPWPPIVVTDRAVNQPRKIPNTQEFQNFQNSNWGEGQHSEKSEVKHILATNIRDLLKKEMEPKPEQNIRLQKNIDNWTALEYSNHKIVGKKEPVDVISHAQAVTSIPGTSISHLLLPSKKIPDGYFTTSHSVFDEPITTPFPSTSVSVNSKPFTTVTRYSTVTRSGPNQRTTKVFRPSTTERSDSENEIPEDTTPGQSWSDLKVSIAPGTNEKVYVVTPVSNWTTGRRSTRHIETTEKYNPSRADNAISNSEKLATEPVRKAGLSTESFTKLEKINGLQIEEKKMHHKSTPLFRVRNNYTRIDKLSKFNKPKPIDKFFATTTKALVPESNTTTARNEQEATHEAADQPSHIFPFRNGGELPLEMAKVNFSSSQLVFKNTGERKTLIKQVKVNNRRAKDQTRGNARFTMKTVILKTTTASPVTSTTKHSGNLQVDVLFPHKAVGIKKGDMKKSTAYGLKKTIQKPSEKEGDKTQLNPNEPNITEDDREDINLLTLESEKNETLVAMENKMPAGVFGETRPGNSSRSLLDTIKLLRDFLADMSEEEESQEKSQQLGRVLEKIDARKGKSKESHKETYKYSFPEFLTSELNLSKDEMNLIEGAMVELRKNKTRSEATTKK